jgi:hypothetical protein
VIGFLGGLVRFLMIVFIVRLVSRGIGRAVVAGRGAAAPDPAPGVTELVRDRVCNTYVPRPRAVRALIGGHEQLFCSQACADRARLD